MVVIIASEKKGEGVCFGGLVMRWGFECVVVVGWIVWCSDCNPGVLIEKVAIEWKY